MFTDVQQKVMILLNLDGSEAYFEYLGFVYGINDSVKGKNNTQRSANSSNEVNAIVDVLDVFK